MAFFLLLEVFLSFVVIQTCQAAAGHFLLPSWGLQYPLLWRALILAALFPLLYIPPGERSKNQQKKRFEGGDTLVYHCR